MPRTRASTGWLPQWDDKIQKWTRGFVSKNLWRCDNIHDVDDLMQDAYLLFLKIKHAYPRINKSSAFLNVYKAALRNALHDHARGMMVKNPVFVDTFEDDASSFYADRIVGEVTNNGYLAALLQEAPEELRMALALLNNNPEAVRGDGDRRENLNQKLRRLLNVDSPFDFANGFKQLLSE